VKIYFCGMIGSGKTTIGKPLAASAGVPFYDLDQEMDKVLGHSFHRLIREKGWVAFRELEYSICKRFAALDNAIIGLGGGTVRYDWNMDILSGTGLFILLTAHLDEIIRRVKIADRPRVNAGTTLEEDVRVIWAKSKKKYLDAADIVYETDDKPIDRCISELKTIIRNHTLSSR